MKLSEHFNKCVSFCTIEFCPQRIYGVTIVFSRLRFSGFHGWVFPIYILEDIRLTRDELLNLAWGWDFDGTDRVIDGHIKKLRRALGPHADCIKTVVKRGYKLEVDGDENQT